MSSELLVILEKESAAEVERILSEARAKTDEVLAEARTSSRALLDAQRVRLEGERKVALARAQSAAQVRAAAAVLQAKDQAINEVFVRAEAELRRLQQDPARYGAVLRALIREAAAGLSGRVLVEVSPDDRDAARQAVRDLGLDAEVRTAPDVSGGVRVATADRRFIVENTLASRIERVKPVLTSDIAALLWGR